nr:MAG TPA: hypothetical protein [Caudoviricetes sp.]
MKGKIWKYVRDLMGLIFNSEKIRKGWCKCDGSNYHRCCGHCGLYD